MLKEEIINLLAQRAGRDVRTPAGSDWLSRDIAELSPQTIKRMTGVLDYDGSFSRTSLDIVAKYLDFDSYPELEAYILRGVSDFKRDEGLVCIDELPPRTLLELRWNPDRRIIISRQPSGLCLVEEAENSKLQKGDLLKICQIREEMPLMVREVIRGGQSLGPYTASPDYGLSFVRIL